MISSVPFCFHVFFVDDDGDEKEPPDEERQHRFHILAVVEGDSLFHAGIGNFGRDEEEEFDPDYHT